MPTNGRGGGDLAFEPGAGHASGVNEAGGSAQRRYEREREKLDASLPASRFWRSVTKLGSDYERRLRYAEAWGKGAEGERRTAEALRPLEAEGWILLNDLPLPERKRANIDHVLIGPPGVFVIETKNYKGRGRVERSRLVINGRDRKRDLEEVWHEAGAVQFLLRVQLANVGLDVRAVLCIHNSSLEGGWFREPEIDQVRIASPKRLVAWVRSQPARLSSADVQSLAETLAIALR